MNQSDLPPLPSPPLSSVNLKNNDNSGERTYVLIAHAGVWNLTTGVTVAHGAVGSPGTQVVQARGPVRSPIKGQVRNIDERDASNPQYATEYVQSIMTYLYEVEVSFHTTPYSLLMSLCIYVCVWT